MADANAPKPHLARLFEAIAAIMELDDEGETRLELIFGGGHLRRYFIHRERRGACALGEYDERAAHLVAQLGIYR